MISSHSEQLVPPEENQPMEFVHLSANDGIAEVTLQRGKVNALNEQVVEEMAACFRSLAADPEIKAVIFTANGSFFSFGFDIPEFLGYSRESFSVFLKNFTDLYSYLFTYPKPLVAALNGHAIAGGACWHWRATTGSWFPAKRRFR